MSFFSAMSQRVGAQRQPQQPGYPPAFGPYGPPPQMSNPYGRMDPRMGPQMDPRMSPPQPAFSPMMAPNAWQGNLQGRGAGGAQTGVPPGYPQFTNQSSPAPGTFDMSQGLAQPWQGPQPNPMTGRSGTQPSYGGVVGGSIKDFMEKRRRLETRPGAQPGARTGARPGSERPDRLRARGGTRGRKRPLRGGSVGRAGPTKMARRGAFEGILR